MRTTTFPNLMKAEPNIGFVVSDNTTLLHKLVNYLVGNSLRTVLHNKSIVVNEIPTEFRIAADESKITPVISALLTTVIANSRNGRIHIHAEKFRGIITVEIQDRNNYNGYALAFGIKTLEPLALAIGGSINIESPQQLVATISFSFPDRQDNFKYDNW